MTWLLRLYPREWRRHYGAEVEEVIASQPKSLQLVVDLLAGAVDAHLKPQALARRLGSATADPRGASNMLNRIKGCGARALPAGQGRADRRPVPDPVSDRARGGPGPECLSELSTRE